MRECYWLINREGNKQKSEEVFRQHRERALLESGYITNKRNPGRAYAERSNPSAGRYRAPGVHQGTVVTYVPLCGVVHYTSYMR